MKKHCCTTACLFAVALACLLAAFTDQALAGSRQEQFILLIANTEASNVVAYSQFSGRYLGVFIPKGRGRLASPDTMIIGPDGRLYISSGTTPKNSAILRFDAKTGRFINVFASGGGLLRPWGLTRVE